VGRLVCVEGLRGSRDCEVQCWGARHRDASVLRRCRTRARLSPAFEFFSSLQGNCWIANISLSFCVLRFSFTSLSQSRSVSWPRSPLAPLPSDCHSRVLLRAILFVCASFSRLYIAADRGPFLLCLFSFSFADLERALRDARRDAS